MLGICFISGTSLLCTLRTGAGGFAVTHGIPPDNTPPARSISCSNVHFTLYCVFFLIFPTTTPRGISAARCCYFWLFRRGRPRDCRESPLFCAFFVLVVVVEGGEQTEEALF